MGGDSYGGCLLTRYFEFLIPLPPPEEAIAKGEHLAQLIYDRTKDQPGKAEELNARLKALQEQDPANGRYDSCQGYQRIIDELNAEDAAAKAAQENQ